MNDRIRQISLDGEWAFFLSHEKFCSDNPKLPAKEAFTGRMTTPGYWDDHYDLFDEEDFFSQRVRFNPDYRKPHFPMGRTFLPHASSHFIIGTGFYRKVLKTDFPAGSRVRLTVGPAMWGCSVFCNGRCAGWTTGYSTASEYDLTGLLKPGSENELILAVCNDHDDGGAYCRPDGSHDGEPYGCRPGQHRGLAAQGYQSERGGIGGGVSLRITGPCEIRDRFIYPEQGKLHWRIELAGAAGYELDWSISDGEKILASGDVPCSSDTMDFITENPLEPWSDRVPKLYRFCLLLRNGPECSDSAEWLWGSRTLTCSGSRILVNGLPVFFRGATEHCYFPETCNPHFDKEKYLHDLGVLRKAGFNFIRCHTWCPPEPFYEACDELGIYVQTELPSVWSFEEAEAILRMIRRHACAVIFCEGNEKKITDPVLERIRQLAAMLRRLAPGMLFNPQEAIRGVEYDFVQGRKITMDPAPHDAERLAEIAEFSDVYGSLGFSLFSYGHDEFPGVAEYERMHAIYRKPCLSHEIGILGGYLDFSLEERYRGTYIGQDLFQAVREHMQKNGVYQYADLFYKNNCRFISSVRKQLMENLRSCPGITGYDYLGGIDTHWHLTGYPCGIFNEFYEEKYGETIEDVRRYNGENVLLCSALSHRRRFSGSRVKEDILLSYFGGTPQTSGELSWNFTLSDGTCPASGSVPFGPVDAGTVSPVATVDFQLPDGRKPGCGVLHVAASFNGETVSNRWLFWFFPRETDVLPRTGVRIADKLTDDVLDFVEAGGAVLLTGGFPARTESETFRTHCSGRTTGHAGFLIHEHPVWNDFPHEGFGDWQFFEMMRNSTGLIYDPAMPEFRPALELIPSFKLIRRKSMLSEFRVGRGRIMMCGLNLNESDPAGRYLRSAILRYLGNRDFAPAPEWNAKDLRARAKKDFALDGIPQEVELDAGGRPLDMP